MPDRPRAVRHAQADRRRCPSTTAFPGRRRCAAIRSTSLARYSAPIFLVLLVIVFTALQPNFLHPLNLMNVLRQVSISGLIAIGMTFVILTGGIDLSVGSLVALTGLAAAYVVEGRAGEPVRGRGQCRMPGTR